jgi:hypothetical protein
VEEPDPWEPERRSPIELKYERFDVGDDFEDGDEKFGPWDFAKLDTEIVIRYGQKVLRDMLYWPRRIMVDFQIGSISLLSGYVKRYTIM